MMKDAAAIVDEAEKLGNGLEGKHALVRCRHCRTPNAVPAQVVLDAMREHGGDDPAQVPARIRLAAAQGKGPWYKCFKCGQGSPVLKSEAVPTGQGTAPNRKARRARAALKRRK